MQHTQPHGRSNRTANRWLATAAALAATLALSAAAHADIYRYVDDDGRVHYTDTVPDRYQSQADAVDLDKVQVIKSRPVPRSQSTTPTQPDSEPTSGNAASGITRINVLRPTDEQTIRDANNNLTISVQVEPPIRPGSGRGIVYFLDSAPVNDKPVTQSTIQVPNVYRGTHTVWADLVDSRGRRIGRSESVTVFMKPPRAN